MTTIQLGTTDPEEGDKPMVIEVKEDFDTAIEKFFPTSQHSSALEARTASIWTLRDGRRTLIKPQLIDVISEDE